MSPHPICCQNISETSRLMAGSCTYYFDTELHQFAMAFENRLVFQNALG
jgi:hypothetical protein